MPMPLQLAALDGRPLHGTVYEPAEKPSRALVVFGALGVPHRYYARFGEALAAAGIAVLSFDYRGCAASRDRPLRADPATLLDWGQLDAAGAVDAALARWPGLPIAGLGHSFGAQSFGLNPRTLDLDRLVIIGAGSGDLRNYPPALARRYGLLMGMVPWVGGVLGYIPGALGIGEDLPAGVVSQWVRWCKTPGYVTATPEVRYTQYADFPGPALFLDLPDDTFAPPAPSAALRGWFRRAEVTHRAVDPATLPKEAHGHFGAFRAAAAPLWDEIRAFLEAPPEAIPPLPRAGP